VESPAPGKVLIDEQARLVLEHVMALEGYLTSAVGSTAEAIEAARREPFDIVLSGLHSTLGKDGLELVEILRAQHPEMQSILLTSDDSDERSALPESVRDDTRVTVLRQSMGPDYLAAFTKNALEYKRLMSALDRLSESGKIKLQKTTKKTGKIAREGGAHHA
jgi:DNA-binding NtrC family response regulator